MVILLITRLLTYILRFPSFFSVRRAGSQELHVESDFIPFEVLRLLDTAIWHAPCGSYCKLINSGVWLHSPKKWHAGYLIISHWQKFFLEGSSPSRCGSLISRDVEAPMVPSRSLISLAAIVYTTPFSFLLYAIRLFVSFMSFLNI